MVVGVVGGSGGVGSSSFAAALAARAAADYDLSVLIDLDTARGGIDVLLGAEHEPGARWSGLRLAGGHLDPQALVRGLPSWNGVAVLAADADSVTGADAVGQVIGVAVEAGPVVVDLTRWGDAARDAAVGLCDLVVMVVRPDVAGITGARAVAAGLAAPLGLLVRGRQAGGIADLVGARMLGRLPRLGRWIDRPVEPSRRIRQVAAGVLDAVAVAA